MTVQYIYVTIAIWGEDIFALKVKTTSKNTTLVTEELIKVPMDIMKLHRDFVMTSDIFFVYTIPFLLTLIRKICFTMVHHLADMKVKTICSTFNEVYIYYIKRVFLIITLYTNG